MGADEGRAGDAADRAGAGGNVLQRPVSRANPRSPQAAQRPDEGVAGAGTDTEVLAGGRLGKRKPAGLGYTRAA